MAAIAAAADTTKRPRSEKVSKNICQLYKDENFEAFKI
jgi:hypothetical protein